MIDKVGGIELIFEAIIIQKVKTFSTTYETA